MYVPEDGPTLKNPAAQPQHTPMLNSNDIDRVPLEDRIKLCGHSIGVFKVKINKTVGLFVNGSRERDTTRPYVKMRLGPYQQWASGVVREDSGCAGMFVFDKQVSFVAQDINSDLILEVKQKNVLVADMTIGQVLVPLTAVIPDVKSALATGMENSKKKTGVCEPYVLESWFEIFPLKEGKRKFVPAAGDIAETGMWKANPSLGFVHLRLELYLHGRISMWAGYALPRSDDVLEIVPPPLPTGDLKAISAVVESGRKFKRNFQRVRKSFSKLASRGDHAWYPIRYMEISRTFQDPQSSALVLLGATFTCLWAPAFMLPFNIFVIFLIGVVSAKFEERDEKVTVETNNGLKPAKYVVWNQDIHDPDDDLGSIQKVAKVMYLLEKFERWMGIAADAMERMNHVFSFADERVTIAVLLALGSGSMFLSFALFFFLPGYLCYFAFMVWFWTPAVKTMNLLNRGKDVLDPLIDVRVDTPAVAVAAAAAADKASTSDSEDDDLDLLRRFNFTSAADDAHVATDHGKLRSTGRISQLVGLLKLALRGPTLAKNIFSRIPTEDELGHRWICELQRVEGEPVLYDDDNKHSRRGSEDDDNAVDSRAIDDGIWLREM